jgi:hypothetical protein
MSQLPRWGRTALVLAVSVSGNHSLGDARRHSSGTSSDIEWFAAPLGDDAGDVGVHREPPCLIAGDHRAGGEESGAAGARFEDLEVDEDQHVGAADAARSRLVGVIQEEAGDRDQAAGTALRGRRFGREVEGLGGGVDRDFDELGVDQIHRRFELGPVSRPRDHHRRCDGDVLDTVIQTRTLHGGRYELDWRADGLLDEAGLCNLRQFGGTDQLDGLGLGHRS